MQSIQVRHCTNPEDVRHYDVDRLRREYVVEDLFVPGEIRGVYTHEDRIVIGGAVPAPGAPLRLPAWDELRAEHFCDRREVAVVNIGGDGTVRVDGTVYQVGHRDAVYVGRGAREVDFEAGSDGAEPAVFYFFSALAHTGHPTTLVRRADAARVDTGDARTANRRQVERYVHEGGTRSAQIVMGITSLEPGSVWNTMPPHTHDRRTEIYLYFGLPEEDRIMHLLGRPTDTRHLVVANRQAVISPSWSLHSGVGTTNYAFVWAMAGENQSFEDMDHVQPSDLR
ncbi:MAG TPA: 5-dehydro-4-deoxy-D-glucuronate isomerase [Micromonospora sp.]